MGWEELGQWGEGAIRIEPLTGGVANKVWSVRLHAQIAVARLGSR
ncbi:aminoglycoside phosphotransferase, partial [Rhizobium ruizarguesonis]